MHDFKNWLVLEEIFPNKTATVYHRTKSLDNIQGVLSSGFKKTSSESWATNCLYGCGLYTTFEINSQFNNYMNIYGSYLIKFKAIGIENYLILQKQVAQYVLGKDYKISDQLRRLVKRKFTQEELDDLDAQQEHEPYTSDILKKFYDKNKWIENELRGAIYRGRNDGYCLLRYYPIGPDVSMIAYSYAPVGDQSSQSSLGKIDWVTSSSKLRIKDIYQSTPSEKRAKQSLLDMSNYTQDSLIYASKNKMYSYITSFLKKTRDYTNKHFSYVSLLIRSTVMGNPGDSEAKMKMIDLILSYKREFSSSDVKEILVFSTSNKDFFKEVVERLGENIEHLNINSLRDFFKHSSDEDKALFLKAVLPYKKNLEESEVLVILESLPDDEKEIIQTLASNIGVTKFLRHLLPFLMNKVSSSREVEIAKAVSTINFVLDSPAGREDREYYLDYAKKYVHSKATHPAHDSIVDKLKQI